MMKSKKINWKVTKRQTLIKINDFKEVRGVNDFREVIKSRKSKNVKEVRKSKKNQKVVKRILIKWDYQARCFFNFNIIVF